VISQHSASLPWLQTILNNTSDAIMIADSELHLVKWNPALEELLRKYPGSIAGKNIIDLLRNFCCADSTINGKIQHVIKNGFLEEEILLHHPNGKTLQLACYAHKLPDTNRLSAIVVIIQDLEKQLRRTLSDTDNYTSIYFSYLENSLAPAWITDEDGSTLFMNVQARRIWNIHKEYRFKNVSELFPGHVADKFIASDRMVLDAGQSLAFVIESIREDGSPGYFMLHKFLLPPIGEKRLIAGQAIDITAEKKAEEAMRESSERFSYVAKAVSDCIWDWDMQTGKVYRSEALMTLTGYTREQIEDTLDWWERKTHPEDRGISMYKLKNFVDHGHTYCDAEYRFQCADGRYRHFTDKGYIIYKDGKPIRAIGVVQDITEQKRMEAKILREKIQKEKEITQAVIAAQDHVSNELANELHDNVNQILSVANLMLDCAQPPECEDREGYIKKSKEYILLAINEIRKISKSLNSTRIKEGLLGPVEEIVSNLRLGLSPNTRFEFDPGVETFLSHDQKLMAFRIIQEQTNNIIKYAEASQISIGLYRKNNSFHLVIKDNGKGFDLETAKNGIGLINIRNRVEAFNGTLNITTSPGKGCCINIVLPPCCEHNDQ
jgi:PAS domain S-box-containing protein